MVQRMYVYTLSRVSELRLLINGCGGRLGSSEGSVAGLRWQISKDASPMGWDDDGDRFLKAIV